MDRTLKVYSKTQHLFAQLTFHYENHRQAKVNIIEYRRLYNDDEEDESKSVYPSDDREHHLNFTQFNSIAEIKAHDIALVKKELGREMKDPNSYTYAYEQQPILLRYIVQNHRGSIGMVNILFSFIDNTKEVKFLSATNPRFDVDISSNSLETNMDCIMRIPIYVERGDVGSISPYDLTRLEPWY